MLVAKIVSGARWASAVFVASALTAGSSKTASMTRSQPARAAVSAVAVMRARAASRFSGVVLRFFTPSSK